MLDVLLCKTKLPFLPPWPLATSFLQLLPILDGLPVLGNVTVGPYFFHFMTTVLFECNTLNPNTTTSPVKRGCAHLCDLIISVVYFYFASLKDFSAQLHCTGYRSHKRFKKVLKLYHLFNRTEILHFEQGCVGFFISTVHDKIKNDMLKIKSPKKQTNK